MDDAFKKKILDYFDLLNKKYDILKISLLKLENKVDKLENKEDGNHHFLISQLENYRQEVNQNHEEIIGFKDGVYNKMDAV